MRNSASYRLHGTAVPQVPRRFTLKGSGENVAKLTPQDLDFIDLLILTFDYSAVWGSDALVCLGTWCTLIMIWYDIYNS